MSQNPQAETDIQLIGKNKPTYYRVGLSLIVLAALITAGCTSRTGITDALGRVTLQAPSDQLRFNGCPYPQDIRLKDPHGNPLNIERVEKQNGTCTVITR